MTTRIDLRLTAELAALIAQAAAAVGETDRSWARAALLRAARHIHFAFPGIPPGGTERLGIPLESAHRVAIGLAAEWAGLSLSDWVRAVLAAAAEAEIREVSAGREKSTRARKKR